MADQGPGPKNDKERLNAIFQKLSEPRSIAAIVPEIEQEMLTLLNAERVTIYQRSQDGREIVSRYQTEDNQLLEIRLSLTPASLAGFVAMSQRPLRIADVYDEAALAAIHPKLCFDRRFDQQTGYRTRSMMAIPIKFGEVLLGLLQVINRVGGGPFTDMDHGHAQDLARVVCHKLRTELNTTSGPYDYLVQKELLPREKFSEIKNMPRQRVEDLLIDELGVPEEEVGTSLQRYYQVPYMPFDPALPLPFDLIKTLNVPYLKRQFWLPVAMDKGHAVVLLDDPADSNRLMEIQKVVKADSYAFRVGIIRHILQFLQQERDTPIPNTPREKVELHFDVTGDAALAVMQAISRLLKAAIKNNASELTVEIHHPGQGGVAKMRVGEAHPLLATISPELGPLLMKRLKLMGHMNPDDSSRPQEGNCKAKSEGQMLELRLTTFPATTGEVATVRLMLL